MDAKHRAFVQRVEAWLLGLAAALIGLLVAWNALFAAPAPAGAGQEDQRAAMLARAAAAELDTEYAAPPGDPLSHHVSGFAKTLCSAVFVTGLDPDFAAENVGFFSGPYEHRRHVTKREVDRDGRRIRLTLPNGVVRTAKLNGDHGCVTLPPGEDDVFFEPIDIRSALPDPAVTPWPMGDALPRRAAARRRRRGQGAAGGRRRLRAGRGADRRVRRDPQGAHHRRALRPGRHPAHAARELVDGEEPDRDADGRADPAGRLRSLPARAGAGVAGARRPPPADPHRGRPAHVERHPVPRRRRSGSRPGARLSRPPLRLHRIGELVRVGGDAPAAVAPEHHRPLPQLPTRC